MEDSEEAAQGLMTECSFVIASSKYIYEAYSFSGWALCTSGERIWGRDPTIAMWGFRISADGSARPNRFASRDVCTLETKDGRARASPQAQYAQTVRDATEVAESSD